MRITRLLCLALVAALPLAAAEQKPKKSEKKPAATPAPAAAPAATAPAPAPAAEDPAEREKTFYALGQAVSRQLSVFEMTESELKLVQEGLADGVMGRPAKAKAEDYMPKVQEIARARMAAAGEKEKAAGAAFAEKAAAETGAQKTTSGLVYKETQPGTGESPKATDRVKVHYTGKLTDGSVFDSSVERGQPAEFPLNGVIPCWTEGVQKMKVGGKAQLVCPASIAYGENGAPPRIKPGATLVFDVELLAILPPPAMPEGHPTTPPTQEPKPQPKPEPK